jgi:hypothetical protein
MRAVRGTRWWILGALGAGLALATSCMVHMPGRGFEGALPEANEGERVLAEALRAHVDRLAGAIGERNTSRPEGLVLARDYLAAALTDAGLVVRAQGFDAHGVRVENLVTEVPGSARADEIVVVGAHYDSAEGCPAANDNASGVAVLLELARTFALEPQRRTLRFVAFVNEEPPHFQTETMGSLVYAKACRANGDRVTAMLSLETMGYFDDRDGSQQYPFPFGLFYPSTGDFIAFVGNFSSRSQVRRATQVFRETTAFPAEGAALPGSVPGVGWSDHWAFWEVGYPGVMVTDTAPFRYPHYHLASDTPDRVDFLRLARVVGGVREIIRDLGRGVAVN